VRVDWRRSEGVSSAVAEIGCRACRGEQVRMTSEIMPDSLESTSKMEKYLQGSQNMELSFQKLCNSHAK